MNVNKSDDHRKFTYALLSRDIRRISATIHRADIDDSTRKLLHSAMERLEGRVWLMSLRDPVAGTLVQQEDTYSDGRPVTTAIDWGDGYATLVHSPDPADETGSGAEELAEEMWPN